MALKLKREVDNTGIFSEYHKIDKSVLEGLKVIATLGSYSTQETRQAGKNPIDTIEFTFKVDSRLLEIVNAYKVWAYNKIKESKPVTKIITPKTSDEDGNIVEAVTEQMETNQWATSEDI